MDQLPIAFKALETYKQFVLYKIVPSKTRKGKTDKFPVDHKTGNLVKWQDLNNLTDSVTAITAAKKLKLGVGFVLTENDPFWFLDIDHCLTNNAWTPLATDLIAKFEGAAVEVSSSKKGLHVIGTGDIKNHSCKNLELDLEFYTSDRFIALTGIHATGNAATNCTPQLNWLISNYFNQKKSIEEEWTTEPHENWKGIADDEKLIQRMLDVKPAFGIAIKDLWEANTERFASIYPDKHRDRQYDESSADAALAQHLAFWTGNDCERMLRLMQQSKLAREKWNRPDYLRRTILFACSNQKEFHKNKQESLVPQSADSRFLTAEQQKKHFDGCTYILDEHSVLIPGGIIIKADQFKVKYGGFSFVMDNTNQRVIRNAWEAFTESQAQDFPKVTSCRFRPDLEPGSVVYENGYSYVNSWWPIKTPRIKGDVTLFLNHLKKLLPNEEDRLIFLCYMAACVQYPGVKFQWCPLLQGVDGNGKTLFSRCVQFAVGLQYAHFPNASEITEKYNDWLFRKIFIGVEDVCIEDDARKIVEILKPMITSDRLEIRGMKTNKIMRDICCNFILNSNHKDGIKKTQNDRRFAPFYTAQQVKEDLVRDGLTSVYFIRLWKWLKLENGFAIVHDYLATFNIPDEFNPANLTPAPVTSSTYESLQYGLGNVEQEILECIDQEIIGFRDGWISSIQLDKLLVQLHMHKKISRNRRRQLLLNLGYDWHPALKEGRVNNTVVPDGGKPRLFIVKDHPSLVLKTATEVAQAYSAAQEAN